MIELEWKMNAVIFFSSCSSDACACGFAVLTVEGFKRVISQSKALNGKYERSECKLHLRI